jgi:hypothetical protein
VKGKKCYGVTIYGIAYLIGRKVVLPEGTKDKRKEEIWCSELAALILHTVKEVITYTAWGTVSEHEDIFCYGIKIVTAGTPGML